MSQCPETWCIYGEAFGVYIVGCATDPEAFARSKGRVPGDGTRLIRIIGGFIHPHSGRECIPTVYLYSAHARNRAIKDAINRSLVAGERPIFW